MAYQLKKEILLDAPRSLVWKTYRDHLPELAVVMPTVESITVVDRNEKNNEIVLENIWKLTGGVPLAIKKLVPKKLLSYRDVATWKEKDWICEFKETPVDGNDMYVCIGKNIFTDLEEKTLLEISFELTIDPQKIPGVPSILAKGLVKKVEPILSKEVAKNLEKTAREVELFIQKNKP